jgi:hypothetical protein
MNDKNPPWGYDEDPWKEMDLFKKWVLEKNLRAIDVEDTLSLIEIFILCSESFDSASPERALFELQEWNDYVQDIG